MGLNHTVRQGAVRLFALAVDANFHKGRRKDYVVASCLYLQSRMKKEPHMLIDFSERLRVCSPNPLLHGSLADLFR